MKTLLNKYFVGLLLCFGFSLPAYAIDLTGLMTIDPKVLAPGYVLDENGDPVLDPATGEPIPTGLPVFVSGSYFSMGADKPTLGSASQEGGTAGGLILGTHQRFILDPDEPHPQGHPDAPYGAGTGYSTVPVAESSALKSFSFFGNSTYVGTNGVSYQSGNTKPPVTATVDVNGNLLVELSSWEVMWNGSTFEQGPRYSAATGFFPAEGTYDFETGDYVVAWPARIVGGPFSGVVGFWHLEGTILADPVNADAVANPRTINVKSQGSGFSFSVSLTDTDGSVISPSSINEGVSITSVGSVEIPKGAIIENVAGRSINGDTLNIAFDNAATGNRQDVIAVMSDILNGSRVTICASGTARDADNILRPFEGCSDVKVNNKGNR